MANETPHHRYKEVTDNPAKGEDAAFGWCFANILFLLSLPLALIIFLLLLIFCKWQISLYISLGVFILIIIGGLSSKYGYDKTSPRLKEAERAKRFLGFDFGNDFRLRTTGSHDYSEILLDFSEDNFLPLMEFCKKFEAKKERVDSDDKITITEYLPYYEIQDDSIMELGDNLFRKGEDCSLNQIPKEEFKREGFTKIESHYDPKLSKDDNLWINSELQLEVDYNNRTLKMFYAGW